MGFFLNIVFGILSFVMIPGFGLVMYLMFNSKQLTTIKLSIDLLLVNFFGLIKMFELMAYTVLYYECKNNKGKKEIESLKYTKIPTVAEVSVDIPKERKNVSRCNLKELVLFHCPFPSWPNLSCFVIIIFLFARCTCVFPV